MKTFLEAHPEVKAVELLLADLNGVLRAKRVRREEALSMTGVRFPGSVFSMDSTGAIVDGTGIVASEGERDRFCSVRPSTLSLVPWSDGERAQALIAMDDTDGTPFFADPMTALLRAVDKLDGLGLVATVAVELELYLLPLAFPDATLPEEEGGPASTQVYAEARLEQMSPIIEDIAAMCGAQGIEVGAAVAESGPAHLEVNLQHQADAVAAVEDAILFKRTVRAVAARHERLGSFMAKPWAERAGSGLHVHVSVCDKRGANIFAGGQDPDQPAPDKLRHALGGLCVTMPEAMAVFAPNANSYRRLKPGMFVPMKRSWGRNNRTAALRIPPGPADAARIEHRVAGADANPALVMAAILAGIAHGLEHKVEPPDEVIGDGSKRDDEPLPMSWPEALNAWREAKVLPEIFDPRLWALFDQVKQAERARFEANVTPLEQRWLRACF